MEKRYIAVGFADLTHFARLFEVVDAEKGVEILQEAVQFAGDAITRHGGRIRKYIGDGILFTVDEPREAAAAAREIAAGFRKELHGLSLHYRVAVASGEVLFTSFGHPSHPVEDIFGPTVNRAAILLREAARSETGVALCGETTRRCQER